jgi:high-affinity iron transporter
MQNFGQILFVMWRETVEAMLVVGILHAWLSHSGAARRGLAYLWGGVAAGLAGACLLGLGIESINSVLSDEGHDLFQAALLLIAAILIVNMVLWMRRHGRSLKRDMERSLSTSAQTQNWWGVFWLATIAVTREGSEAVVFLSSLAMGSEGFASGQFWLALLLGFALAAATFYLLQLGGRFFSWRLFFRVTEILLLLLGCALFIGGTEKLIGLQILPALKSQVWDSSAILDDSGMLGGLVASFTGYRAQPPLMSLLVFIAYWLAVFWLTRSREAKSS